MSLSFVPGVTKGNKDVGDSKVLSFLFLVSIKGMQRSGESKISLCGCVIYFILFINLYLIRYLQSIK